MEVDPTVLAHDGADFLDWLNDAGLVIHGHHGNERRVGADRSLEFLEIKDAVLFDSKVGNIKTLLLQLSTRIEDTFVFLFWKVISEVEPIGRVASQLTVCVVIM